MSNAEKSPAVVAPADPDGKREPEQDKPKRHRLGSAIVAVGQFAKAVVFAPLVLVRGRRHADFVIVYSAHPSFYLWMLVLTGFVLSAVVNRFPAQAGLAGWIYVWVLVYFVATLLYDFSARKLFLWIGIFMLIWLGAKYVEHVRNIIVLGYVFDYLARLEPKLDPGTATVMSWLLLLPWIGSIFHMVLNGRKHFTPNEIGEFHFGEGSELTDRSGLRFRTQYRDVLETILTFGGGDLLAVDNHQNVIKRWDNIIGLFFIWSDLDRVLQQRSVVDEEKKNGER